MPRWESREEGMVGVKKGVDVVAGNNTLAGA